MLSYVDNNNIYNNCTLSNSIGDHLIQKVHEISVYTPYKSLETIQGIYKQQDDQSEIQLAKLKQHTQALAYSGVTKRCDWIHWNLVIITSISYFFGVCHLNNT